MRDYLITQPVKSVITMAHGAGCKVTKNFMDDIIKPLINNPWMDTSSDSSVLQWSGRALAFSTNNYVVNPLFFSGGNIGDLALTGTLNNLAMSGARAKHLSLGLILEEGLLIDDLKQVIQSLSIRARHAGVSIVAGDTKVIDTRNKQELYINTTGIGALHPNASSLAADIEEGDSVIITGDIGRHGLAVMIARDELAMTSNIESDLCCLVEPIMSLLDAGIPIKRCHDLTRGGLGVGIIDIATASDFSFILNESEIPISPAVDSGCELLSIDPLFVANAGCALIVVSEEYAEMTVNSLQEYKVSMQARIIGECIGRDKTSSVSVKSAWGTHRKLALPPGENLSRVY
ncbi:MAG: hydrogenase expression/formation protein HypE [Pseudomonadota bacterium]